MKTTFTALVAVFTLAFAPALYAQSSASSGASSTATATNTAASGAISGAYNQNVFTSPSNTTARIENVPSVSAPSLGGGGHPCLAPKSGGISIVGGGISYGQGEAEVVCMLAFMGQHEAAIRALVANNAKACKAIANVGYYVVPMGNGKTKAVRFNCDKKTVRGGIYSNNAVNVGATTGAVSSKSAAPTKSLRPVTRDTYYRKCEMRGSSIYIKHKYTDASRKATAVAQCKAKLGH